MCPKKVKKWSKSLPKYAKKESKTCLDTLYSILKQLEDVSNIFKSSLRESHDFSFMRRCISPVHQIFTSHARRAGLRASARARKVPSSCFPCCHCCVISEQKLRAKPEILRSQNSAVHSSQDLKIIIMAVFNWNYLSFVSFDSTWVYREMVLIPILIVILWFVWMKVVR